MYYITYTDIKDSTHAHTKIIPFTIITNLQMFLLPKMLADCQEYFQVVLIVASGKFETNGRRTSIQCDSVCVCVCAAVHVNLHKVTTMVFKLKTEKTNWFNLLCTLMDKNLPPEHMS